MKNKKNIMTFSALLILIYHLWIYVYNYPIEIYLKSVCIIGVDIFFFISAYGLSKKNINYKEFILNRFNNIYLKFIILSLICFVYSNWKFERLIKTVFGIDLFLSGGGSFLWFLPGIMIVYLLIPLYIKLDKKDSKRTILLSITLYIVLSILISLFTNYKELFILTNRIPIILLGYYFGKYNIIDKLNTKKYLYWLIVLALVTFGNFISYQSIMNRFKLDYFRDIIYIVNIPLEIGLILLINRIKDNKITKLLGDCTLELYGIQMIFGFKIANEIYKYFGKPLISNIITIFILIILSIVLKYLFNIFFKTIQKLKKQ